MDESNEASVDLNDYRISFSGGGERGGNAERNETWLTDVPEKTQFSVRREKKII